MGRPALRARPPRLGPALTCGPQDRDGTSTVRGGPRVPARQAWCSPLHARSCLHTHTTHTQSRTTPVRRRGRQESARPPTHAPLPPSEAPSRGASLHPAPCTQPGTPPLRPTRGWVPAAPPRCCGKELGTLRALGTAPGPRGTFVSRGAHSPRPSWCTFVSLLSSVPCRRSHRHSGTVRAQASVQGGGAAGGAPHSAAAECGPRPTARGGAGIGPRPQPRLRSAKPPRACVTLLAPPTRFKG